MGAGISPAYWQAKKVRMKSPSVSAIIATRSPGSRPEVSILAASARACSRSAAEVSTSCSSPRGE